MMLQAFPSAQSSITADSAKVYLFAVEEFSLEALKRACRSIVRGGVKDLKPDFPPAAPKLAQIVKDCEDQLAVERFEAGHLFVVQGTDLWKKIELQRGHSLPTTEKTIEGHRHKGWHVTYDEAGKADQLELPPVVELYRIKAAGFTVGDDHEDAA
jgi:hypothetical protein